MYLQTETGHYPDARQIWDRSKEMARLLDAPASDVGSGLARVPAARGAPR